ncbi:MAG TPA: HAD-IIA family hydrolase [Solirubrobacterales bacterium]|nr:HAD-IIA family hydrolase [Solirubrobacterales bacterium]
MALADDFDGFLIDLDGVVWIGREPVPEAPETLVALLAAGKRIVFVTNNPAKFPAAYAERLRGFGVAVGEEQIVTAGMVAARLAREAAGPDGSAFVISRTTLKEMVAAAGVTVLEGEAGREAGVVVVSGHRDFDYTALLTAKRALDRGAALIGTSRDPTMPMPGGEWPGTGAILAAVETASGRVAEIAGKPERHLFELALTALAATTPPDNPLRCSLAANDAAKEQRKAKPRVAMVGDRLSSDIEGGHRAGLTTILVRSGTDSEDGDDAETRPDHVVDDLAALLL